MTAKFVIAMLGVAWLRIDTSSAATLDVSDRAFSALRHCLNQTVDTDDKAKLTTAIDACTIALESKTLAPNQRADALVHRGIAYRNASSLDKSLSDLLEAKSLAPSSAEGARMLAWTYRTMRRYAEAEGEYDRALQLEPHSQAYLSRCVVRIDLGLYEKALSDCETAYRMNVNEDSVYFTGWLYGKFGRQADAMQVLEPALNSSRASGRIYGELAHIYEIVGRKADAERLRDLGRRLFPNDPDLAQQPPPP